MHRFIKKGSKGIALIDYTGDVPRIRHVFDVADTGESRRLNSRSPNLWKMENRHMEAVTGMLQDTYNATNAPLQEQLFEIAEQLAAEYYADHESEILEQTENSLFVGLDDGNIQAEYRDTLAASLAYTLCSRCGLDTGRIFTDEDFPHLYNFNTLDSITALGTATSELSEQVLVEIGRTVKFYDRGLISQQERSNQYDNVHMERGISGSPSDNRGSRRTDRQVRADVQSVPEGTPDGEVQRPSVIRQLNELSNRNRPDRQQADRAGDGRADAQRPAPGQTERPAGVDAAHERSAPASGGNDSQRIDLQVEPETEVFDLDGVSASGIEITDAEIDEYLKTGSLTQDGKYRILSFFLHDHSAKEKADFLKHEYGHGGGTYTFASGERGHADATPGKGITIAKGGYINPDAEKRLTWSNAAKRIDRLITDNTYMSQHELDRLPRYEHQMLGAEVMSFFYHLPEDVQRPIVIDKSLSADYWSEAAKIGDTLDNPETVAAILTAMRPIMENTPDSDRYYETRKTAFENLTAFENGTFTLFPHLNPARSDFEQLTLFPTEQEQITHIAEAAHASAASISQDEIDEILLKGNHEEQHKFRVYDYMQEHGRERGAAAFLREEFAARSFAESFADGHGGAEYSPAGLTVFKGSMANPDARAVLSWPKVQARIMRLIVDESYLSATELAAYADWKQEPATSEQAIPAMPVQAAPEPDFDTVAKTALERVMQDVDYLAALTDAKTRAALRNPCGWALEQSIRDHEQDEPEIFHRYFHDRDFNERLYDYVLKESYANRPQPEQAHSPDRAVEAGRSATMAIADFVKSKLETGEKFSSAELFAEAAKVYGDTMANNAFTPKDAYDAMELGVNQYMLSLDHVSLENILKTLDLLPSQTRRTDSMEKFQQFSSPPGIAYLANLAANIRADDIVVEPSAGIGGIALFAKKDGATVYVNELDKRRLEIIKNLPFDGFYNEDAEQINNILGDKIEPTVIVMNPPFSSSAERNIQNTKIGAKHIEEALKMLAPNGRLVAVVGQGMADDAPAFRNWWRGIKEQYNVKANIGVDGKNYNKYGTSFGIQMLVIDKNGATIEPVKTAFVENLLDLQTILGGIRNDRPSNQLEHDNNNEQNPIAATRLEAAAEREPERRPNNAVSDTGGGADTAAIGDRREQTVTSEIDTAVRGNSGASPGLANVNDNGRTSIVNAERHSGNEVGNDGDNRIGRAGALDSGQSIGSVKPLIKPPKPVKTELTDSIFENYEPQPLLLENVQPHPANISESAAMSAIQPPPVMYKPTISQDIIDKGILSDVQLEAVTYAGQSHNQTLPNGNARGFFLGDGTGVGKGRTITGIILDNYVQGRQKAVWLSENRGLIPDAKRDVKALFGDSDLVVEFQGGKKADASLSMDEGILFATYSALSKSFDQSGSNFEKIVNWLGKDFDGVIVFDEAHNMANSIATKGNRGIKKASQRGMAGLAIQEALPKAKIVYSSATGATEVENLRYAERLGLWGEGTAFVNGDDFVHKIKAGGLAAMELIARDMKAMGVYLSRNISYEDVVYDKIVHELTPEQRKIYDELARSWQIVLQNITKALETTNQDKDGTAKGQAYSAFWGAQQRFFNQILTAMQVPSMITDIQGQLDNGNSVVVQLVSTNEAAQEREFTRLQEQDLDLEDFDLTPKQMLMSYIENSFPTVQFEEYTDDNGNIRSKPVFDSEGNAVINREAVRQKEMLLDKLGSIKVPASALDMIINHFGSDMVAENTGRKRRVVVKDGKAKEENIASKKEADVTAFQNGDKRIIVFSKAGGTGKSYHADKSAKNQQHRVHYLLQAGWQADAAVQGFGRSHRSNQVSAPTVALVTTDLKGQMRFISTIAKRLDQLGALTKGQRQTGSQGLFTAGDNLENAFAADVLALFYKVLIQNGVHGVPDGISIIEKLGLKDKLIDEYGQINPNAQELREVNKFLNRILSLESSEQNAVFDGYAERLHIATERALQDGTLDKGLENFRADKVVLKEAHDIRIDETTGATTKYYSLTAYNKIKPLQFRKVNTQHSTFMGFYQSKNTGAVRAAFRTSSITDEYGNVCENCRLTGQDGNEYMPQNRLLSNWNKLTPETAEILWDKAVKELPEFRTNNLHLIGGTVLPVWDKLPTENVRIYRVLTSDGDLLIGRVIPEDMIDATLHRLGATREKEKIPTEDLLKRIKNGDTVYIDNGWRIVQKRVSNEQRIEVIGADYLHSDLLAKKGVFTERIAYQTRYFIPAEKDTIRILDEVIKISPVSRVESNKERSAVKSDPSVVEQTQPELAAKTAKRETVAKSARPSILEQLKRPGVARHTPQPKEKAAEISI